MRVPAKLTLLPLLLAVSVLAQAQTPSFVALDRYLDTLAAHDQTMGTLAVMRGDSVIYARAVGSATLDPAAPATPDTRYRIGSISKTYTAALVMRLAEEGKVSLDDGLARYFPDVPGAGDITIRQMLAHRSGINSVTDDSTMASWKDAPVSRADMLARMATRPSVFAPDSKFGYSNSNYILLTYLVEEVTGQTYAEALRQYVLAPLGLARTVPASPVDEIAGHARSYTWGGAGAWVPQTDTDPSVPLGAGAVSASAAEVGRFYRGLLAGRLLSEASLAQMSPPAAGEPVGFGLFAIGYDGRPGYGHTGAIDGFRSQAGYWPADSLTVVFLSNATRTNPNDVGLAALHAYHGREVPMPDFNAREVAADPAYLATLAGVYSAEEFPLDITIAAEGAQLTAQATGQGAFPLTALEGNVFVFEAANIRMHFPEAGVMEFSQGGMEVRFERE